MDDSAIRVDATSPARGVVLDDGGRTSKLELVPLEQVLGPAAG